MNIKLIEKRIYNRIATEQGSFLYNPEMGSKIHTLKRAKNLQEVYDLVFAYVKDCLRPEFKNGTVKKVENLRVKEKTGTKVFMEIDVILNNDNKLSIPIEV